MSGLLTDKAIKPDSAKLSTTTTANVLLCIQSLLAQLQEPEMLTALNPNY
jgi:hypothetical protein